jgi:hypothetical protein
MNEVPSSRSSDVIYSLRRLFGTSTENSDGQINQWHARYSVDRLAVHKLEYRYTRLMVQLLVATPSCSTPPLHRHVYCTALVMGDMKLDRW